MTLIELINFCGEDSVEIQSLTNSLLNVTTNKKGISKVSFETDNLTITDVACPPSRYVGYVVWVPREKFDQACQELS